MLPPVSLPKLAEHSWAATAGQCPAHTHLEIGSASHDGYVTDAAHEGAVGGGALLGGLVVG